MPALAMTLPIARRSPIIIPRRDIVLPRGDTLRLALTLVESDRPDAALYPVEFEGLGSGLAFRIWGGVVRDDYGWSLNGAEVVSSVAGVTVDGQPGRVDVTIEGGAIGDGPGRFCWSLDLDGGGGAGRLAWGVLNLMPGRPSFVPILTDGGAPVLTDQSTPVGG